MIRIIHKHSQYIFSIGVGASATMIDQLILIKDHGLEVLSLLDHGLLDFIV